MGLDRTPWEVSDMATFLLKKHPELLLGGWPCWPSCVQEVLHILGTVSQHPTKSCSVHAVYIHRPWECHPSLHSWWQRENTAEVTNFCLLFRNRFWTSRKIAWLRRGTWREKCGEQVCWGPPIPDMWGKEGCWVCATAHPRPKRDLHRCTSAFVYRTIADAQYSGRLWF